MKNFRGPEISQNHRSKCFYLLSLIKIYSKETYSKLNDDFLKVEEENSYEFYQKLLQVYKDLKQKK